MGPLKIYDAEEISQWLRFKSKPVSQYDVEDLLGKTYLKCHTGEVAVNGFKRTGVYSLSGNVLNDADFIPACSNRNILIFSPELARNVSRTSLCSLQLEPRPSSSYDTSPFEIALISITKTNRSTRGRKV